MSTIKIKCVDQVLSFTNMPVITAGDQNVDKVKFDFCPLWDGFIKIAVFFQQKNECSYALINADGSCNIPNSILKCEGKIFIAVTGTNSKSQVRTSNILSYYVDEGIVDASLQDEFPEDLSNEEKQDIYNKMLELVVEMQTLTQDLIHNFAYVRIKDGNEFSYDVDQLRAQIRAYTYEKAVIDKKISDLNEAINTTIKNLSNTVTNNSAKIKTNETNITSLRNDVDTLKTTTVNNETYLMDQQILTVWRDQIEERFKALEG